MDWPILRWIFWGVSALCIIAAILPMWGLPHGAIRLFDFPRLIFAGLSVVAVAYGIAFAQWTPVNLVALGAAAVALAIQLVKIAPYTPLANKTSRQAGPHIDPERAFTVIACNVKQGNDNFDQVIDMIRSADPDIAVFMEVDHKWQEALTPCTSRYPHVLSCVLDNSYGILLIARTRMLSGETRFLTNEEIPSFHCCFELPSGDRFNLIALHPEPPVPNSDTVGRDAEISVVGRMVQGMELPVLVTGDLNDVAWSQTTDRFRKMTGFLDPRKGRGMFNSFHADYWFVRWPLDHLFHSPHFSIVTIERQPHVGSDHFPMLYGFVLDALEAEPDEGISSEQEEEVDGLIETGRARDERPVGTDWED